MTVNSNFKIVQLIMKLTNHQTHFS